MLHSVRHDWPEKAGFLISRPQGLDTYTFLHFSTSIRFKFGDTVVDAQPGACIFYAPHVPQYFGSDKDVVHNWLHTTPALSALLEQFNIPQNEIIYPADPSFVSGIFRKLEAERFSDHPHKNELIDAYLTEFLVKFSRALHGEVSETVVSKYTRDKLRQVRLQVLSHPEQPWTVAQMAKEAALSPSRFHTVYKMLFASSPLKDLIEARVRHAQSLLIADEPLSLNEVAEKLGYHDPYHLIRQFKSVTGITPGAYRKQNR